MKVKNMTVNEVIGEIRAENYFNEQMMFRLVSDCKYYLGHGGRDKNVLWAKNEEDQIFEMRRVYNHLVVKPRGIADEDIRLFDLAMHKPEKVTYIHYGARYLVWDHLDLSFVGKDAETDIDKYNDDQWFLERWEIEDEFVWLVWIGGKIVDYIVNKEFVNEILEKEAEDIKN